MQNSKKENLNNEASSGNVVKKKRKGKLTPFGRFLDIIGTLIMLAALVASLAFTIPRFIGMQTYVVVSGSMEPTIPVGSLVYSKQVEPKKLEQGDVIVFYSSDASLMKGGAASNGAIPITHRVVENRVESSELITKGDANANNDFTPVSYINVVGKVSAHVPGLGLLAVPFATSMGKIAVVMVILAGFLLTEAGNRMRR
ncbi:MAG: signal peptidase I [Mogibacterium sp.]|nr:signal peptidase I [Mogibacterium sp.]